MGQRERSSKPSRSMGCARIARSGFKGATSSLRATVLSIGASTSSLIQPGVIRRRPSTKISPVPMAFRSASHHTNWPPSVRIGAILIRRRSTCELFRSRVGRARAVLSACTARNADACALALARRTSRTRSGALGRVTASVAARASLREVDWVLLGYLVVEDGDQRRPGLSRCVAA